jgi:hypothetical protein
MRFYINGHNDFYFSVDNPVPKLGLNRPQEPLFNRTQSLLGVTDPPLLACREDGRPVERKAKYLNVDCWRLPYRQHLFHGLNRQFRRTRARGSLVRACPVSMGESVGSSIKSKNCT